VDSVGGTARVSSGSGYNPLTTTATVNTSTGSGAILEAVVSGGAVVAVNVVYGGAGYHVSDTINIVGDGFGRGFHWGIVLNSGASQGKSYFCP
jgi:hypothetical protein